MTNQYHFVQLTFLTAQGSLLQYIMGTTTQTMFEPQRHAVRYKATTPKQRLACAIFLDMSLFGGPSDGDSEGAKASFMATTHSSCKIVGTKGLLRDIHKRAFGILAFRLNT